MTSGAPRTPRQDSHGLDAAHPLPLPASERSCIRPLSGELPKRCLQFKHPLDDVHFPRGGAWAVWRRQEMVSQPFRHHPERVAGASTMLEHLLVCQVKVRTEWGLQIWDWQRMPLLTISRERGQPSLIQLDPGELS